MGREPRQSEAQRFGLVPGSLFAPKLGRAAFIKLRILKSLLHEWSCRMMKEEGERERRGKKKDRRGREKRAKNGQALGSNRPLYACEAISKQAWNVACLSSLAIVTHPQEAKSRVEKSR